MRHADIRNTINVCDPNMDESKRQQHYKLVCLVCGNNSWIHDLMLRLATGRGKIEPWRPPYSYSQLHTEDGKRAAPLNSPQRLALAPSLALRCNPETSLPRGSCEGETPER